MWHNSLQFLLIKQVILKARKVTGRQLYKIVNVFLTEAKRGTQYKGLQRTMLTILGHFVT